MKTTYPMCYSKSIQTRLVLPPDTNHHDSIFGGKVLAYIYLIYNKMNILKYI